MVGNYKITRIIRRVGIFTIGVILLLFLVASETFYEFYGEKTEQHTIQSIDKVENTTGDSDGFYTEIYYIVTTDKGIYHINTTGFNAHPECVAIKVDSTYMLTTRGMSCPFIGMYTSIIGYKKISHEK